MALLVTLTACGDAPPERSEAPQGTGLRLLGAEPDDAFARATEPREFVFPADHGSHPEYRTEWWYFTGNLESAARRHFGFELTFFRYALAAVSPRAGESAWRTNQVWMAHFAITNTEGRRFIARERLTREALDLAGAEAAPLRIWVEDWAVSGQARGDDLELRLEARDDVIGLQLDLVSTVPHVAQGDGGLDAKGAGYGNASHYYSVPRLAANGLVTVDGETFPVTGLAWLDREWSTSSLEPGIAGWDWFALHLSDGSDLMFYRLRTVDGETSPFSSGSLTSSGGIHRTLDSDDVVLTELDAWASDRTGVRYPIAWRLTIPDVGLVLDVRPYLAAQELDLSVRYWEGAMRVSGRGPGGTLTGSGYLELAGYE
jgi:predicted secreted hydrolase